MDWSFHVCCQDKSHGMHSWEDTRGLYGGGVCQLQISDWDSRQQEASLRWLWDLWCQPCSRTRPNWNHSMVFFCFMVLQRDIIVDCPPVVYHAIESLGAGMYIWPVPHCIGGASMKWALRWHFLFCHTQDLVVLPSEGTVPFPKCERCGMQTKTGSLYGKHQCTWLCHEGWERKSNMKLLRLQWLPSLGRLWPIGRIWRGWKYSNIWGGCWHMMTTIPRPCNQTWRKHARAGHGFLALCRLCRYLGVRQGNCLLWV